GLAVGSQEGERVLDLCAAPGGKATQLRGEVTAVEVDPGRARELRENIARLGASNVHVVEADATALPPELTGYDRALVDAPCSGLGVLAARPDLRWRDWVRTVEIEPSIYAADFTRLGDQVDVLLRSGVRIFHFDVGDGHFVEPITMGPIVLRSISPIVHGMDGALDCHLMVDNPVHHFPQIAQAGGDSVTFHYEAVDDVPGTIAAAREHGLQVGVAFNPESEPEDVAKVSADADVG